jgi:hypothetical protein
VTGISRGKRRSRIARALRAVERRGFPPPQKNQGTDMARNHFAIEPPGRIRISIPGYSPEDNLKEQAKRRNEKRKRQRRRDEAAAAEARKREEAAASERLQQSQSPPFAGDDDVEALSRAASRADEAFSLDLAAAFSDPKEVRHENE